MTEGSLAHPQCPVLPALAGPGPHGAPGSTGTYCLNLVRVLAAGVPMTSWILEIWSSSLAPGKRGCRLEERDKRLRLGQFPSLLAVLDTDVL